MIWQELADRPIADRAARRLLGREFHAVLALRFQTGLTLYRAWAGPRRMWHFLRPKRKVEDAHHYITNGVHTGTWIARRLRLLFTNYLGAVDGSYR